MAVSADTRARAAGVDTGAEGPVIALENVSIAFGDHPVFAGLDLAVPRGRTTVIVGRSGSGKTLLLKLMMGLVPPDRGRVRVFGHDLAASSSTELTTIRARMSMVFQNYALFDALPVEDNVEFPLVEVAGTPARDAARQAHELLARLGLADSEHALPETLSGGMKRRVALARALVSRPDIALLDEPTTGLDPVLVEQVDELIAAARTQRTMTLVIVTHDLASVQRLADRVAFLDGGKITFVGSYDEFLASPLPSIRSFLAGASSGAGALASLAPSPDAGTAPPVIELVDVHKWFGDNHALRGVDLAIYPGRITALIGGSGSGKSVLVRHIAGLLKPDRGKVLVFGRDIVPMSERELDAIHPRLALVFQHGALLDWLDVEGNVAFPLVERRDLPTEAVRTRVDELLERMDLAELRHRMPGELSAGERKRVALARAMVTRPDVLIYDEPTTGQDPVRSHEIEDLIVQTQQRFGVTTLVISHDMTSTFRIANTIAMLCDGKIIACGTPDELRASTDPRVRDFLRAAAI